MVNGSQEVQVPPRLMLLLELLVADAGKTVSRDELIEALWPRGFVNEEALSRAVNELRSLLGDNARNPEFIRTVPKRGYRLIADIGPDAEPIETAAGRSWSMPVVGAVIALVLAAVALFQTFRPDDTQLPVDILSTATRLTADPGMEWQPEISSDGQWVAQVVALEGAGAIELFPAAAPEQKRIISHPGGLFSPAFSPDSSKLATLSGWGDECRVLLWPVAGWDVSQPENAEFLGPCYRLTGIAGLDWSADGSWLAIPTRRPEK